MNQILESCLESVREFGVGCRVGVVGSREFGDMGLVEEFVSSLFGLDLDVCFVSGGCRGVDKVGEKMADKLGMRKDIIRFKGGFGRGGGMIRNGEIVDKSDVVVCFWDGKSKGTLDTFNKARKVDRCKVFMVKEEVGDLVQGALF